MFVKTGACLSTSSSFSTACLPWLRSQAANFGSFCSMASANSLLLHSGLCTGQYPYSTFTHFVLRSTVLTCCEPRFCETYGAGNGESACMSRGIRDSPFGTSRSRTRFSGTCCISAGLPPLRNSLRAQISQKDSSNACSTAGLQKPA